MIGNENLQGRRVLVVEDELMISMLVEDMLADLGCSVVGPAHELAAALALANSSEGIDAALLDVNLGGQSVFPVADALRARGVPSIFSTGYGEAGLRDVDRGAPVLQKPFRAGDLARALQEALKTAA
jgi:CheY-like chemotaxis protein